MQRKDIAATEKLAIKWMKDYKDIIVKVWNEDSNGLTIEVA